MTPVFELNHLQVSLRGKKRNTDLVKGVSFSVKQGECLGILGESGSGKSMSIKAAMGIRILLFPEARNFREMSWLGKMQSSCAG